MAGLFKKARRGNSIEKSFFEEDSDEEQVEMKSGGGTGQEAVKDETTHGGEEQEVKYMECIELNFANCFRIGIHICDVSSCGWVGD